MLVVDASALAPAIVDGGDDGARLRRRLHGETVAGPDLLRIEVVSVIRRQARTGSLTAAQADAAIDDLLAFPIWVLPTASLLPRAWELREDVTAYDGCFVALAEVLACPLVTADRRLATAPGTRCEVEVV